jgi:hypothetical protein
MKSSVKMNNTIEVAHINFFLHFIILVCVSYYGRKQIMGEKYKWYYQKGAKPDFFMTMKLMTLK